MPEVDRLLGEMVSGIRTLGKSVDNLRTDQQALVGRVDDGHSKITKSIGDMQSTISGLGAAHDERIKANKDGISLIWRVLIGTGALSLLIGGAVKAMSS